MFPVTAHRSDPQRPYVLVANRTESLNPNLAQRTFSGLPGRLIRLERVACRSNYRCLAVLFIGTLALSSNVCSQVDAPSPAPVAAYEHSGAQIDTTLRPGSDANTAAASNEQTRVAGKLTGTSKPLAVPRAGNHPPGDKGRLIFSTASLRYHSACLRFVPGRSPPSGCSTQL